MNTTIAAPVVVLTTKALDTIDQITNMLGGLQNPFPLSRQTTGLVVVPYRRETKPGLIEAGVQLSHHLGEDMPAVHMRWLLSGGIAGRCLMVGWYRAP